MRPLGSRCARELIRDAQENGYSIIYIFLNPFWGNYVKIADAAVMHISYKLHSPPVDLLWRRRHGGLDHVVERDDGNHQRLQARAAVLHAVEGKRILSLVETSHETRQSVS